MTAAASPGEDSTARRRRGRPPSVSRDDIVRTARLIVVADGVEKLTMRRLGSALGLDPMVPYRFFPTKDDLLEAVFVDVVADIHPASIDDPVEAVASAFLDFRAAMLEAPSLFAVVGPRLLSTSAAMFPAGWVVEQLSTAGLRPADALRWNTVLLAQVVGSLSLTGRTPATDEIAAESESMYPALSEAGPVDVEAHFRYGFERLVRALREDVASNAVKVATKQSTT